MTYYGGQTEWMRYIYSNLCVGLNVLIIPGWDKMKTFYNTKAQNKGKQKKIGYSVPKIELCSL